MKTSLPSENLGSFPTSTTSSPVSTGNSTPAARNQRSPESYGPSGLMKDENHDAQSNKSTIKTGSINYPQKTSEHQKSAKLVNQSGNNGMVPSSMENQTGYQSTGSDVRVEVSPMSFGTKMSTATEISALNAIKVSSADNTMSSAAKVGGASIRNDSINNESENGEEEPLVQMERVDGSCTQDQGKSSSNIKVHLFVIGTTLYICMSSLHFGYVFSLLLTKKTNMFTVLCRHAHCDWQSTEVFLNIIGKSNIMLTWKYIGVLNIKGKHNFKHFYYIHIIEIPTQKGEHS